MPWAVNNETQLHNLVAQQQQWARTNISSSLYRSRTVIDIGTVKQAYAPLHFFGDDVAYRLRISSRAVARGIELEENVSNIKEEINSLTNSDTIRLSNTIQLRIYNTANNPTLTPAIKTMLSEEGFTERAYSGALICTPFHDVSVHITRTHLANPTIVVLTNVYTTALFFKLSVVVADIVGVEYPEDLIRAILEGDKAAYNSAFLAKIQEAQTQERDRELNSQLATLRTMLTTAETENIRREVATRQNTVNSYLSELRNAYQRLKEAQIKETSAYWGQVGERAEELITHITQHDKSSIIKLYINTAGSAIKVVFATKLLYWSEEAFTSYDVSDSTANLVTRRSKSERALLRNIFLDKTVQVLFNTGVVIDFNANEFYREQDFGQAYRIEGLFHPHIHYANCWGDNSPLIYAALNKKDYVIAWEQIKATLSGLTITDYTIFKRFIVQLMSAEDLPGVLYIPSVDKKYTVAQFLRDYPQGYKEDVSNEVH